MKFTDLKYLAAFIIPGLVYLGINSGGFLSYSAVVFAFVIVPILEPLFSSSEENLNDIEKQRKLSVIFFDLLLYLNLPLNFFLIYLTAYTINNQALSNFEIIGLTLSLGTLLGSCGINVAHELGHKQNFLAQICSVILLTPSFYNHFIIEHNKGHHKYVATPGDPATAKLRESIYRFWIRSVVGTYLNAWKIEFKRMEKNKWPKFYYKNLMILFFILNVIYVMAILYFFGTFAACVLIAAGTISFLFLETINYVEHYGLKRDLLTNGRYERVMPKHSWNSNHYLGRIILYELTRHSDHHYLANKKYQILDHHESSPQLPYGYPSSMLLSLIPPLWFKIMDKRLKSYATV